MYGLKKTSVLWVIHYFHVMVFEIEWFSFTILNMLQHHILCVHEIGGSLGCNSHTLVEFAVLRNIGHIRSKVRLLNLKKIDFQLLREIVSGVHGEKGMEQSWQNWNWTWQGMQRITGRACTGTLIRKGGSKEVYPCWWTGNKQTNKASMASPKDNPVWPTEWLSV